MQLKDLHTHVEVWGGYEVYMERRPKSARTIHINAARAAWSRWASRR
jgi:hypothetical protein